MCVETARIYRVLSRIGEREISGLIDGWRLKSAHLRGFLGSDAVEIGARWRFLLVMRGSCFGLKGRSFMCESSGNLTRFEL